MEVLSIVTALLVGIIIGAAVAWLMRQGEVRRLVDRLADQEVLLVEQGKVAVAEQTKAARVGELEVLLRGAGTKINELTGELAAAKARAEEQAAASVQQIARLIEVRDGMLNEFKVLAADITQQHGETFSKRNEEQITSVLTPLRDRISEFQQSLQAAHTDSVRERASLVHQLQTLGETSARMTHETENLTRALKGDSKIQGAWGEMKLALIFERSGLQKGDDFVTQQTHSTEEGGRIRPDAIVDLPDGQRIIIDAKVSLTAYEHYANATTDDERALYLGEHTASMRSHVERLASKEYWQIEGSRDFVIMFVPIEGALGAALQNDKDLITYAFDRHVGLATPTTLLMAMKTVASVWRVEYQNRNAQEIASRAAKLYDKFVGFVDDMQALDGRLAAARTCYDLAMGKLRTGQGNLVWQAERLKELGISPKKSLPKEWVGDDPVEVLALPAETLLRDGEEHA